jgi:hypothetical protein
MSKWVTVVSFSYYPKENWMRVFDGKLAPEEVCPRLGEGFVVQPKGDYSPLESGFAVRPSHTEGLYFIEVWYDYKFREAGTVRYVMVEP